ncbi:tRNA pseudouridine synthase A [Cecembia lonarensis]|uniref:tRNA pseudouridine synthase A n=1 Tax=Cecembia lonarensis (strain CCUG 58316 / KCTC 22772 / LW9) TaxID=1225176 RepID=K1LCQ1_CECL9|nr:pseudouridylate synthase [Cecembia lonarensis]EKB48183.1 tRNA pseudouridine synthase A [Cecembia lonarensis LW9]
MQTRPYSYLFYIQYLGLRYAGWQKQKGIKTVQGTIERGIRYVLGHEDFSILGASRTDSGVSCEKGAFQLFLKSPLEQLDFLERVNANLPSDIRLLALQQVPHTFNIIQDIAWKEYHYHMAFGDKFHPFAGANLSYFPGNPDLGLMQKGARAFVGRHDFRRFCAIDKVTDNYHREVYLSEVVPHPMAGISHIPENALVFKVNGKGFLRYQVRIMAAALVALGLGQLSLEALFDAFQSEENSPIISHAAPNGLVLFDLKFKSL